MWSTRTSVQSLLCVVLPDGRELRWALGAALGYLRKKGQDTGKAAREGLFLVAFISAGRGLRSKHTQQLREEVASGTGPA